jgi:hypothetical protein
MIELYTCTIGDNRLNVVIGLLPYIHTDYKAFFYL